ncbi:MAG: DNA-binding protein [Elusimicrobiales bacterium]|nr:DNA-binding protein [Elusimicrobiales bacterium]
MAEEKPFLTGRTYIFRLDKGDDLLAAIQEFCHDYQIKCGVITALGAVDSVTFGFFDQKKRKYVKTSLAQELEVLNVTGNVSIMDDKPMVHAHITVADSSGKTTGGHLMAGTRVFACEVFVQELVGTLKIRKADKATGLPIWANAAPRE